MHTKIIAAVTAAAITARGGSALKQADFQHTDTQPQPNGTRPVGADNDSAENIMFEKFTLTEHGSTAETTQYEAVKTENGVRLTCYIGIWGDDDSPEKENHVYMRTEGGSELYSRLTELASECGIDKWNGFSGYNPNVLDGSRFTFEAKLSDGTGIYARGNNSFPDNYRTFSQTLYLILSENK